MLNIDGLILKKLYVWLQNYGDEPEAVDLLFPSNFSENGVSEHDFRELRTR